VTGGNQMEKNIMFDMIMYIVLGVVLLFVIIWTYKNNAGPINAVAIGFNRAHLYVFSFLPGHAGQEAGYAYQKLGQIHPAAFTFHQIMAQFNFVGQYLRWIFAPILGCLLLWGWFSDRVVSDFYKRIFTMQTLVEQNVDEFPCMAPIANRKRSILEEPLDEGPWRTPRQPIQFVAEHKLLIGKDGKPIEAKHLIGKDGLANQRSYIIKKRNNEHTSLDIQKTKEILIAQLGPKFPGVKKLPDYQKGLAAAFMAFGCGNKSEAKKLLDQMSTSFVEPENEGDAFEIDIDGADDLINQYQDSEDLEYLTCNHVAYTYVWFAALLNDFARKKGILASSQFIWLRPVNRSLWYTLNQMGGREAWSEAEASWAHYESERLVEQPLGQPEIETAITGLYNSLVGKGWIAKTKKRGING
jgi:hypothetical protein